jgi:hypothetical protein
VHATPETRTLHLSPAQSAQPYPATKKLAREATKDHQRWTREKVWGHLGTVPWRHSQQRRLENKKEVSSIHKEPQKPWASLLPRPSFCSRSRDVKEIHARFRYVDISSRIFSRTGRSFPARCPRKVRKASKEAGKAPVRDNRRLNQWYSRLCSVYDGDVQGSCAQ